MCFRKHQSVRDLHTVLVYLLDNLPRDLTAHEASLRERITVLLKDPAQECRLNLTEEFWASLLVNARSPKDNDTAFLFATGARLLDRFENPARGSDFQTEWEKFSENYRGAPSPVRAALMNGFEQARKQALVSDGIRPTVSDRTTSPEAAVLSPLIDLARSLTAEEREEIAQADYGANTEQQLDGLNRLLDTTDCRYPKGESWFPAEVVELTSHEPHKAGFVGSTALLLINAIHDGDTCDQSSSRWKTHHATYKALELEPRRTILSAFRHIYETISEWDPFWEHSETGHLPVENFIPSTLDDREGDTSI